MNKKGFTLIELLVVIVIIGILAVALLPAIMGAPGKSRDSARIADIGSLQRALEYGSLQAVTLPAASTCIGSDFIDDTDVVASLGGSIPQDPKDDLDFPNAIGSMDVVCTGQYVYIKDPADGYSYGLYAKVENNSTQNAVSCDALDADPTDLVDPAGATEAAKDADSCYAVLVQ
jgi:prepilin-type N-terminal cleavage/methylation domain-containing protein